MREIVTNYERQELFDMYNGRTNPFVFITIKVDITKAYEYSRVHKNLYQLLCYTFTKAMNNVDNFKYRVENNQIVKYDIINPNFTEKLNSGDVSFLEVDLEDTFEEYFKKYEVAINKFRQTQKPVFDVTEGRGSVWLSCLPWANFTSVVPPYDIENPIPQLIWDKYQIEDDKVFVNLMIMTHHGFTDGAHICKLIEEINKELEQIEI